MHNNVLLLPGARVSHAIGVREVAPSETGEAIGMAQEETAAVLRFLAELNGGVPALRVVK